MAPINWIQYNERVVGENSPIFPNDVDNRPLKEVIIASGLTITEDFPGFPAEYEGVGSPEGVVVAVPGQLYFQTDSPFTLWCKQQNLDATGWGPVGAAVSGTGNYIPKYNAAGDAFEDSIMFQSDPATPSVVGIIIGSDPFPLADETFRITGGMISAGLVPTSTRIGPDAVAIADGGIAIGSDAISTGIDCIAIGTSARTDNLVGSIAIGGSVESRRTGSIAIGETAKALGGTGCIAIGNAAAMGVTLSTTLNDSMIVGAASSISSAALTTGAFQSAIVIFGPRNVVTTVGGQPANYVTVVGVNNLITAAIGGTNGSSIYVGQFITVDTALNMVVVGNSFAVSAQAGATVAIGNGITSSVASTNCVYIGNGVSHAGGNFHIIIGRGANKIGAFGDNDTIIGDLAQINNIDFAIVLGSGAKASGGQGNIAIGRASNVTHTNAIAIGPGAVSERNNSCVIGSDNSGGEYLTFVFGNRGDTSPSGIAAVTWRPTNAETGGTANLPTAALIISGGIPLGNDATANSGEIQFVTGAPGGSSNAAQTATKQFAILKSAGGAATPNTAWFNVTSGAAAQVGTLTNAPTAGNATFWLPVQIMGATYYIPCWS